MECKLDIIFSYNVIHRENPTRKSQGGEWFENISPKKESGFG